MTSKVSLSCIREEVRRPLDRKRLILEATESVIGARTVAVTTYRVNYGHRLSFKPPPALVKFSEKRYAIPESPDIQLGSSRYYREHEDDNIADPEEGRMIQRGTFSDICKTYGVPSQPWYENVSSTATLARPDFLMFCASVSRQGRGLGELQSQFPGYDCATLIPDPSAFAMQLGRDVGTRIDLIDVRLSAFDEVQQIISHAKRTTQGNLVKNRLDTDVFVFHGPVEYCDPPARIVNRFPIGRRGEVVPFVKRRKFAGQHEYRFVVEVIGEPKDKRFSMEVSDELRILTRPFASR